MLCDKRGMVFERITLVHIAPQFDLLQFSRWVTAQYLWL
jgi:hypothetical protein